VTRVARYAKATAKPGQGDALSQRLLQVAEALEDVPGCELYLINRSVTEPDVVWVTELWRSQEDLDASLQSEGTRQQIPEVLALVEEGGFERIDLEPLGGVGHPRGGTGFTVVNLESVEDMAPKFGLAEMGESRFAGRSLDTRRTAISHQRLRPGRRQAFGHHHLSTEEIYIVPAGSGRVRIDDEVREIGALDAIRVAPESKRAFEAGPEGLEIIAVGPYSKGDTQMLSDFWPAE
jgi:quinol monooxygenase YgiN/mannose-6-phosphate isomerase-like protein (cupin superfamily)